MVGLPQNGQLVAAVVSSAIISLGAKEMQDIIEEGKDIHVDCQFCDTVYTFTPKDIQELLDRATKPEKEV